ncbi:hypothetical protein J3F83DRAFT_743387 [Trichoderma novae-zelandiae]
MKGIEPNPIRTDNLQEIPELESDALPLRHGSSLFFSAAKISFRRLWRGFSRPGRMCRFELGGLVWG